MKSVFKLIFPLLITFKFGIPIPICRFVLSGKCLGDPPTDYDVGFPKQDANCSIPIYVQDYFSCIDLCDSKQTCLMAAYEGTKQLCQVCTKISYQPTMASNIFIYRWYCCDTNSSYPADGRCQGFWTQTLKTKSDNIVRKSDPLVEFRGLNDYQCMVKCLENGICGAINMLNQDNLNNATCQLIIRFPVEDLYTYNHGNAMTYQWTCAYNYTLPDPDKQCMSREHHSQGYWKVQNTSMILANTTEHLLYFYTSDYKACLDNCALYQHCIRAWYGPASFYCLLEADNDIDVTCKNLSYTVPYTFTTYTWNVCPSQQHRPQFSLSSSNDCGTLDNTENVYIYPITCGYPPTNKSNLFPCLKATKDKVFSHSLHCQTTQSYRILNRMQSSAFLNKSVVWQQVFTGYDSFWLVNVTRMKFRMVPNYQCIVFDARMSVPDHLPLRIIRRTEWFASKPTGPEPPFPDHPVKYVIISDTERPFCGCLTVVACSSVMRRMQIMLKTDTSIPYSFVVAGDGTAYEGRGWDLEPQIATAEYNPYSFAIALCGRYKHHNPTDRALSAVKQLISLAIKLRKVSSNYSLFLYNDLRPRDWPYDGLRKVIYLWPHYRGYINKNCQPIKMSTTIVSVVAFFVFGVLIGIFVHQFFYKLWHAKNCNDLKMCRIDTIYSNICKHSLEILPQIVMRNITYMLLEENFMSLLVSPVFWIEDTRSPFLRKTERSQCSCRKAIFSILDICRLQSELVNIGSLTLLPELRCCSKIIAFVFQGKQELGEKCLLILHFSIKDSLVKFVHNLHQNRCICDNFELVPYKFQMQYDVTKFTNLRKSLRLEKGIGNMRTELEEKYTYAIESNNVVRDYY